MKANPQLPRPLVEAVRTHLGESRCVIAFSGGLDSTVLLHACVAALGRDRVVCAHVHHHLRPEADADAEHCRKMAGSLGVAFELSHIYPGTSFAARPIENNQNVQADARARRYAALARICDRHGCDVIVTAHHADDAIESFLERASRGAGISAVTGLHHGATIGRHRVVRPFLDLPKRALREAVEHLGVHVQHDESNDKRDYRRNAIRHEIVPALAAEHGLEPLYRTVANLRDEARVLEAAVAQLVLTASAPAPGRNAARLERRWLDAADPTLRRRALVEVARDLGIALEQRHFAPLERTPGEPARVDLPGGHAIVTSDSLSFYGSPASAEQTSEVRIDLAQHPEGALPWYDLVILWGTFDDGVHLSVPSEAQLCVRGPRPGETLRSGGKTLKVKDLLRNAGIPPGDRWRWPCVAIDHLCVALPGIRATDEAAGEKLLSLRVARRARHQE